MKRNDLIIDQISNPPQIDIETTESQNCEIFEGYRVGSIIETDLQPKVTLYSGYGGRLNLWKLSEYSVSVQDSCYVVITGNQCTSIVTCQLDEPSAAPRSGAPDDSELVSDNLEEKDCISRTATYWNAGDIGKPFCNDQATIKPVRRNATNEPKQRDTRTTSERISAKSNEIKQSIKSKFYEIAPSK